MAKRAKNKIKGVITALVTPFKKGKVDYPSLKKLLRHQMDNGVQGFVVGGTTAESPVLIDDELEKIFKYVADQTDRSVPLILGTGSNSTAATIEKTQKVKKWKADAALVVVPYYNKPPQRGLIGHFEAVASKTKVPILLYNVPGRTIVSMSLETVKSLAKNKYIIGIKEASGDVVFVQDFKKKSKSDFLLLSGDDASCVDFMLAGGQGVISVISHIIPSQLRKIADQSIGKDSSVVYEYKKYTNLNKLLGIESNPMPVKMMLHLMGLIDSPELRLPLVMLSKEKKVVVQKEMKSLGLL